MNIKMSELQKSALMEAGNIGSGHAAIALSQLMGKKIMIAIPSVEIFEFSQINNIFGNTSDTITEIVLKVLGDVQGAVIFALTEETTLALCDIVMGQPEGSTKTIGELEESALKEIGSIATASYLNAVSEMTGLSLLVSTPHYNHGKLDFLDKLLTDETIETSENKNILCIKTEFIEASTRIDGFLLFVPAEGAIEKIMNALGI